MSLRESGQRFVRMEEIFPGSWIEFETLSLGLIIKNLAKILFKWRAYSKANPQSSHWHCFLPLQLVHCLGSPHLDLEP